MRDAIVRAIAEWQEARNWVAIAALTHRLQRKLNAPLSYEDVEKAIEWMERRERIRRRSTRYV
jgi:hypothetical protein